MSFSSTLRHCHRQLPGIAFSLALFCCLVAVGGCAHTATPSGSIDSTPLIEREVFFGNPDKVSLRISPDGKLLSYLAPFEGVLNVWIMNVDGSGVRTLTKSKERPIRSYSWARNSEQILYSQDKGGNENTHLYAVDLASGKTRDLTPFENTQARITATHRDRPDHILVTMNNRVPTHMDTVEINTRTGDTRLVFENNQGYVGVIPDDNWVIRGRVRMTADGGSVIEIRDSAESEWFLFATISQEDAMNTQAIGFTKDGKELWMLDSRGRNTSALVRTIPKPGGSGAVEVVFQNAKSDLVDSMEDEATGEVQGVATSYFRKEWHFFDENIKMEFEMLAQCDSGEVRVTSRTRDDQLWTVAFVRDDGPVRYHVWDRRSQKNRFLFTSRSELEGLQLAKMKGVEIKARDGLRLPSYLTTPAGREAKSLPMVLMVHGGPWARDNWGYNPYHQWLANRGYAVLSVNFRGSTGFGKKFVNAGDRQWYKAMQDDLVDAVQWAVDEGIADADRVAILGGSYGGYATLAGLTRDPKLFACGVDIVGPSHIRTLLQSIPPYWKPIIGMFEARVGRLSEPEFLDEISPLTHVDKIERPLLIGQGANDPRVKITESDQIVTAMKQRNIPVTYVVFPDEGHGFAKPQNNMAFNAVTEAFLARHLGGRVEPIGDQLESSTADVRESGQLELTSPIAP